VDSACNVLAINKERLFSNLDKSKTRKIKTAHKRSVVQVKGVGDAGSLKNAYWCPDSSENLCGVNILNDMGYMVILDDYCTIVDKDTDTTVVQTAAINGIYVIYLNQLINLQELKLEQGLKMNSAIEETDELKLLHERLGHINNSTLVEACRCKLVEGIHLPRKYYAKKSKIVKEKCHICSCVKLTRHAFRKEKKRSAKYVGELVSTDLGVFKNHAARVGTSYVQTFTDHASKNVTAYGLKKKSDAIDNLKKYVNVDCKKLGESVKHYHADGAGELVGRDTLDYLDSVGVSYSWSPTDTPEMNSVTERKWRTLNQMTRCLLLRSGLPTDFWWDAYEAAVWIHNRTPTKTARGWMTPYEFIHGEAPDISNLRISERIGETLRELDTW
jgi:hypothetical protein